MSNEINIKQNSKKQKFLIFISALIITGLTIALNEYAKKLEA